MKIFDFFRKSQAPERTSAMMAKERLKIVVSHESARQGPNFINDLQRELLAVISKYIHIDQKHIDVQLARKGDQSVLELNVTLPDSDTLAKAHENHEKAQAEQIEPVKSSSNTNEANKTKAKHKEAEAVAS